MIETAITKVLVPESQRLVITEQLFGVHFPLTFEPAVYWFTRHLAEEYSGGYWDFHALSNGAFLMTPSIDRRFHVVSDNGYVGEMSPEALGICACLYAFSHLSFQEVSEFANTCARQFHLLRDYALEHREAGKILRAID